MWQAITLAHAHRLNPLEQHLQSGEVHLLRSRSRPIADETACLETLRQDAKSRATWCRDLARSLQLQPAIAPLLPEKAVAVQCILFAKCPEANWLVALHQDLSIPVCARVSSHECVGWSEKEGEIFVQPPLPVLEPRGQRS